MLPAIVLGKPATSGSFDPRFGTRPGRRASWPVGRVLCTRLRGPTAIHLGLPLPAASSGLPASSGGPPSIARAGAAPPLPLDLAPGGVYRAAQVTLGAGGLLHHRFTLTPVTGGGLLSVALSRGSPRVGVTDHPALRSPDLPRRACQSRRDAAARPAHPPLFTSIRGQLAHGLACAGAGSTGHAGTARPISGLWPARQ
jgi:hypothetical protein